MIYHQYIYYIKGYVYGPQTLAIIATTQPQPPTEEDIKIDPELAKIDKTGWTKSIRPVFSYRTTVYIYIYIYTCFIMFIMWICARFYLNI
jgi:hypothetical protein